MPIAEHWMTLSRGYRGQSDASEIGHSMAHRFPWNGSIRSRTFCTNVAGQNLSLLTANWRKIVGRCSTGLADSVDLLSRSPDQCQARAGGITYPLNAVEGPLWVEPSGSGQATRRPAPWIGGRPPIRPTTVAAHPGGTAANAGLPAPCRSCNTSATTTRKHLDQHL